MRGQSGRRPVGPGRESQREPVAAGAQAGGEHALRGLAGRLVGRGEFLNLTERALRRRELSGALVAILCVDLDGSPGYPHPDGAGPYGGAGEADAGEHVRRAAAARMLGMVRRDDVAAQVGSGVFAILCDDLNSLSETNEIASRLRRAVRRPFEIDGASYTVTAITGIAVASAPHDTPDALLDAAMHAAQRPVGPARGSAASPMGMQLASTVIHRVFGVGLILESAAGMADEPTAAQLRFAVDELDALIRDIRIAVFHPSGSR